MSLRSVVVVALAVVAALLAVPGTASAAPTTVGYDVSYPQCGTLLPQDRAFAIIGVNGGLSTRANPCLAAQLNWAWEASGAVAAQPRAQLYLNTANPGELRDQVTTWPTRGATPYGSCDRGELDGLLVAVRLGAGPEQPGRRSSRRPPARRGWTAGRPATRGGWTSRR